jgi:hypothetical protein
MQTRSSKIVLAVGLGLALMLWSVKADQGFQASGHLEITAYKTDGSPLSNHHSDFEIEVNGNQWEMTSRQGTGHIIRVGSDGKYVYTVMAYPSTMPLPAKAVPPAIIDSGFYYLSGTPYENVVWYAFASSCVTNDVFPAPWLDARHDPIATAFVAKVEKRFDSGLPAKVQFFVSQSQVQKAATNENLLAEMPSQVTEHFVNLLDKYKNNFLAADYEALDLINVGMMKIPLHFKLRRFTPDYPSGNVFEVFDGTVSNWSYSNKTNFAPENFGIVGVTDFRFKNVKNKIDGIRYQSSNQWFDINNTNLLEIYKRKLERKPQPLLHSLDQKNRKKLPILIVMAIIFISPAFFMIRKLWKK